MISKEAFCKALQMIQEQSETDAKFSRALDLVGDGYFIETGTEPVAHDLHALASTRLWLLLVRVRIEFWPDV